MTRSHSVAILILNNPPLCLVHGAEIVVRRVHASHLFLLSCLWVQSRILHVFTSALQSFYFPIKMDNCDDLNSFRIKLEPTELIIKDEPIEVAIENSSLDIIYDENLPTLGIEDQLLNTQVKVVPSVGRIENSNNIQAYQKSKLEIKVEEDHITRETSTSEDTSNLKNKRKRKHLEEKYCKKKRIKPNLGKCNAQVMNEVTVNTDENIMLQSESGLKKRNVGVSTEVSTRFISTQTTFRASDEVELKGKIKLLQRKLNMKVSNRENENALVSFQQKIQKDNKMCLFYTGFVYAQIVLVFNFVSSEKIKYWGSTNKKMGKKKYTPMQEFILTLVRLRTGLLVKDLSYRFNMSPGFITRIFTTWIQLMFCKFNQLRTVMFPSREKIQQHLPACFSNLKNVRVIIDCAEFFCQAPSNFEQQGNLYSHYKAHTTFKVLLGCTPNGAVSFISDLFEGSISDREIVEKSNLLDLLGKGDIVLADRGFTMKDLTDEICVGLNIPPFLRGRMNLTAAEEVETKIIARNRIYIEHVVGRIKHFRLLKKIIPLSMRGIISQCVLVCGCLLNFQAPIVNE